MGVARSVKAVLRIDHPICPRDVRQREKRARRNCRTKRPESPKMAEGGSAPWCRRAQKKWGPASLPAPICAETRLPVFVSLVTRGSPAPRSLLTVSGVASETGSQSEDGFRPFRGPSWVGPSVRAACSRGSRVSRWMSPTLPAPLPAVRLGTEVPPHRHPVEIGSSVPAAPSSRCRSFR